jgi:hypothetical protein
MRPRSHLKTAGSPSLFNQRSTTGTRKLERPKIMLISRLLLNDQLWSQYDVVVVEAGKAIQLTHHH